MNAPIKEQAGLIGRLTTIRGALNRRDPAELAAFTGAELVGDGLVIKMWRRPVRLGPPEWAAIDIIDDRPLDPLAQALLVFHLYSSDGRPTAGDWIAFTELPEGRFYTAAFQAYTGQRLTDRFDSDLDAFRRAAVALGGSAVPFADAAFRLEVLPRLPLLVVCWLGDDFFDASFRLLFDANAGHHLPTDACAVLGSLVTGRLLAQCRAM